MIDIKNISLAFGDQIVFDEISWLIPEKGRVGLVGNNGTGKTTLFKSILGQTMLDDGSIEVRKNARIGYLRQGFVELEDQNILSFLRKRCGISQLEESIKEFEQRMSESREDPDLLRKYQSQMEQFELKGGYAFESRAKQVLKGLGFAEDDAAKSCLDFSSGWRMRISLAEVLLADPDIMLLDEPTNFLDSESMEWLEDFLKGYNGTILAVVHDRMFLDKIATEIAELASGQITLYKGNYTFYEKEKQKRKDSLKVLLERQEKEIKRIQNFVDRFRAKASKASQVQSRLKMLEKFEAIRLETEARKINIRFPDCPRSGNVVLGAEGLSKHYGDLHVFDDLKLTIERGDRVALVGVNGAGKSTLLRTLSGTEPPSQGKVTHGHKVDFAFYSQEHAEGMDAQKTIWEDVSAVSSAADDQQRRNLLGAFLFSGDAVFKPLSVLSGGEKSRLALLKLLLGKSNLLILDEPTNHLDMITKEIFQQALLKYEGTLFLVSHDRYFLDRLVTRVLEIREGSLHEYRGNYSYFIEKRGNVSPVFAPKPKAEKKQTSYERRKEEDRRKRKLQKRVATIEAEIESMEQRKVDLETQLYDPEIHRDKERADALGKELRGIPGLLDELYERWNTASASLERKMQESEES